MAFFRDMPALPDVFNGGIQVFLAFFIHVVIHHRQEIKCQSGGAIQRQSDSAQYALLHIHGTPPGKNHIAAVEFTSDKSFSIEMNGADGQLLVYNVFC